MVFLLIVKANSPLHWTLQAGDYSKVVSDSQIFGKKASQNAGIVHWNLVGKKTHMELLVVFFTGETDT